MCTDFVPYSGNTNGSEWVMPLLKGKYKILIYSGDTDAVCPTRGNM